MSAKLTSFRNIGNINPEIIFTGKNIKTHLWEILVGYKRFIPRIHRLSKSDTGWWLMDDNRSL